VARVRRPAAVSKIRANASSSLVDILDMRVDASRAWPSVFLASSRAKRLAMRPLDPVVLVAIELLGVGAEVAGVGLLRHGVYEPRWREMLERCWNSG
tara:strand:- start:7975 stop:8265 length:291 start_codon:yes stop_codon:yes gene_type:complete